MLNTPDISEGFLAAPEMLTPNPFLASFLMILQSGEYALLEKPYAAWLLHALQMAGGLQADAEPRCRTNCCQRLWGMLHMNHGGTANPWHGRFEHLLSMQDPHSHVIMQAL